MRDLFDQMLRSHSEESGVVMPGALHDYLVDLLESRLRRVDLIPDPSWAERWLLLAQNPQIALYKDYADSALFFCSILPDYGQRRGLSMDYYATLGISSYYTLGDLSSDDRYVQLGNWFYHLQRYLNSAIKPEVRLELWNF